jgi:sugar-specific transcriptional regulator TrmB
MKSIRKKNTSSSVPLLMTFGISKEAAELYLTLLEYGPHTVSELARKHFLSRTTAYTYLKELQTKELCLKKSGSQKISSLPIHELQTKLEESIMQAHNTLESTFAKVLSKETAPEVKVERGSNAPGLVYRDLALTLPKGGTYFRYTPRVLRTTQ